MAQQPQLTSELLWTAALVTGILDIVYVGVLVRLLKPPRFQRILAALVIVSPVFWCALYTAAGWGYWESCYGFLFADWVRWVVPLYGLVSGAVLAPLFWWLAARLPGHPVLGFAALGGLHSLPGHLIGIYGRDMLELCPMLTGVGANPALVFGVLEFIFYWCAVLTLAALATTVSDKLLDLGKRGSRVHESQ